MRTRFDHLGKGIGQSALEASGTTVVHAEITPEVQYADIRHEPDLSPAAAQARARIGLLGRIASTSCLIEMFNQAPSAVELRGCLGKHIASWQQRIRKARAQRPRRRAAAPAPAPFLWILSAGTPKALVAELRLEPSPGWPAGVYLFGGDVLRVGLIVTSQLPRDRSTLLVRLMTAGPQLPHAIKELGVLSKDAQEWKVARQPLLDLQHALVKKPSRTPSEQEFIVAVQDIWEQAREQGRAEAVLTVLEARGIKVSSAVRKRILAMQDRKCLDRWLKRACVATSLDAVLEEPAAPARMRRARRMAAKGRARRAGRRAGGQRAASNAHAR